jgi:hypothetical protein
MAEFFIFKAPLFISAEVKIYVFYEIFLPIEKLVYSSTEALYFYLSLSVFFDNFMAYSGFIHNSSKDF